MDPTANFSDTETTIISIVIVVLLIALLILRVQGNKKINK